jgi:membrane protein DedA with SNARE-associated domain
MELPGVFGSVAPFLEQYGYLAVALVLLVDNLGIPLPGEAVLATGAVFAGAGHLDVGLVAGVAFVAAVLGGNGGYAVGRYGGHPLVMRVGRRIGLTPPRLARLEGFFEQQGVKVVLVSRFVPLLRQFYAVVAGTSGMPWWRFFLANLVGAALWIAFWTTVGYNAGDHLDVISRVLSAGVPVLVAVLLLLWLARRQLRRRRSRRTSTAPVPPTVGASS